MRLLATTAGTLLVALTLWDVFSIMVLTRRANRQLQLSSFVVYRLRKIYIAAGRCIRDRTRRENFLGIAGPLLLFVRFGLWSLIFILAYAAL